MRNPRQTRLGPFKADVDEAKFLIVPLVPSRAFGFEVEIEELIDGMPPPSKIVTGAWTLGVAWEEPVPRDAALTVRLEHQGAVPIPLRGKTRWLPDLEEFAERRGREPEFNEELLRRSERSRLEQASGTPTVGVGSIPRSAEYREFFKQYDLATNPLFFEDNPLDTIEMNTRCALYRVGQLLWNRAQNRYTKQYSPDKFKEKFEDPISDGHVVTLSTLQRPIFEQQEVFRQPPGITWAPYGLRWDRIEEAFDLFASGNLMDFAEIHNYMPDSENVFLFAEFALLAHERGIDAEFWVHLINVFTRMQDIFLKTFKCMLPMKCPAALPLPEVAQLRAAYQKIAPDDLPTFHEVNIKLGYGNKMSSNLVCPKPAVCPL